jgi:ubiquinol-cytochrome c reductase cytochrome c subunit
MYCSSERNCRTQLKVHIVALSILLFAGRAVAQDTDYGAQSDPVVRGNAEKGRRLYDRYGCYQCHGGQGQGSILTGPRIGPNPTGFSGFARYIRQPAGDMPPYTSKVVSDADLADIWAFLEELPRPQDADKIPLLTLGRQTQKKP